MALLTAAGWVETEVKPATSPPEHIQGMRIMGADGAENPGTSVDGVAVKVLGRDTSTVAAVIADATTVKTFKAANANRVMLIIYNRTDSEIYLKFGSGASLTSYTTIIPPNIEWTMPVPGYNGVVTGVFSAVDAGTNHQANVTEY